jgi:tRNA(adenine34) deaminase
MDHSYYMNSAYQEALKAFDDGEVPVGAVIIHEGRIVGRGYNRMEALNDPTAHAEIIAMGAAAASLGTWRLNDCILYVTLEPCLMCLGAMLQARVGGVVYAASDSRLGALESHPYGAVAQGAYRRFPEVLSGVMAQPCRSLIQSFFQRLRKKS